MEKEEKWFSLDKGQTPVWMMRQAGRYLPEYRAVREKAGSFWGLCRNPELAAEVSLQPVKRFGFDAAIVFSDILEVPAALGVAVRFDDGGPKLQAVSSCDGLDRDEESHRRHLSPVYETIGLIRARLPKDTALIGFAGAPWTLATYMTAGKGGDEAKAAKLWAYRDRLNFVKFVDILADCVASHLIAQLEAGADTVQLFDSWAGGLPEPLFQSFVLEPAKRIVSKIRKARPEATIIGFPRGIGLEAYRRYAQETGVDIVSIDTGASIGWAAEHIPAAIQGNLDPVALIAGGRALEDGVRRIKKAMAGKAHVFNLGHGILPETPPEHVDYMLSLVRSPS